jgi:hypothetical protein
MYGAQAAYPPALDVFRRLVADGMVAAVYVTHAASTAPGILRHQAEPIADSARGGRDIDSGMQSISEVSKRSEGF